jgi:hypothetical protein
MTSNERELYEVVIALQAEISALKELMFQASPELAASHQQKTNRIREQLLEAWEKKRRAD